MIFTVRTNARKQCLEITDRVQDAVRRAGVRDGLCHVMALHATAAIVVNENDDPNIGVELNREFTAITMAPEDVRAELERYLKGGSSFETFYAQLAKGGRTIPGRSADDEAAAIAAEKGNQS